MALKGLQIYSLLPKTNCKKCGYPTCLAFAMALAQGKVKVDLCPDISDEGRQKLSQATQPPMKTVQCGLKDCPYEIGGEEVLFRHEKTFFHHPLLAVLLHDTLPERVFREKVQKIKDTEFKRVGEIFRLDMIALKNDSQNRDTFIRYTDIAKDLPLMLISNDLEAVRGARKILNEQRPVVLGDCTDEWLHYARESDVFLVIIEENLGKLAEVAEHAQSLGLDNLILYPEVHNMKNALVTFTHSWNMAIEKKNRALGFPLLGWAGKDMDLAAHFICKYAGIIILESMTFEELLPLITLRLNIYTDPRQPQMVDPRLYEIGKPDENSPALVTTNFSLTFFTVQSEIENSQISSYLLITDSEGMSVQTAYAADKFNADVIVKALRDSGLEEKVKHRNIIIIPGYAAILKASLEDQSGWKVVVGPKEANAIPKFLKTYHKSQNHRIEE
jgi:acetyl-CoA decarbonylase/synthase complex subunit gamma